MEEFGTHFLAMKETEKQSDTSNNKKSDFSRHYRHKCTGCGTKFQSESDLQRHNSNLCDGNTPNYVANYSPFITYNVTMLKYSCTLCGNKFEKEGDIKQHIFKKHHVELSNSHTTIGTNNSSYLESESIQMNETIKQEVLEQSEVLKTTVNAKTAKQFDTVSFSRHYRHKCTDCGSKFKYESDLERHNSEVHIRMNVDTIKQEVPEENEVLETTVNGKLQIRKTLLTKCAVNSCSTMAKVNQGLYRFPESVKLKKKWLKACHLNLSPTIDLPDDCKIVYPGFVFI